MKVQHLEHHLIISALKHSHACTHMHMHTHTHMCAHAHAHAHTLVFPPESTVFLARDYGKSTGMIPQTLTVSTANSSAYSLS